MGNIKLGLLLFIDRKITFLRLMRVIVSEGKKILGVVVRRPRGENRRRHLPTGIDIAVWKKGLNLPLSFLAESRLKINPEIVQHRADLSINEGVWLLGQHFQKENNAFNYLLDPGSNYIWSTAVEYLEARKTTPEGADIKCPWELSRGYHFILLGEAYLATRNEIYAKEFREQILNWIKTNPFGYGPNWNCTMEVGIRIANWLAALLYFVNSPSLDDVFYQDLLISAQEHGWHIMSNLENLGFFPSNHYLGDIAGLYFLAILCPILNESKKWQKYAKKELEREIFRQTYNDGWDYEFSSTYHRLVTEIFYYPFVLGRLMKDSFSKKYAGRLLAMIKCIKHATKPNAQLPQIGDNDSGRFLVFNCDLDPASLNVAYINSWLEKTFNATCVKTPKKDFWPFKQGGRYIFEGNDFYFIITAEKRYKLKNHNHAHNDQLAFELNVCGKDIFVDPGTYTYTRNSQERNLFRSIKNHNVLHWPEVEPNSLAEGIFILKEKGSLNIEKIIAGSTINMFRACYSYDDHFHRREIVFNKVREEIFIKDSCSHLGAQLTLVCGPKMEPKIGKHSISVGIVEVSFQGNAKIELVKGEYSSAYGIKSPVAKIIIPLKNQEITTHLKINRV